MHDTKDGTDLGCASRTQNGQRVASCCALSCDSIPGCADVLPCVRTSTCKDDVCGCAHGGGLSVKKPGEARRRYGRGRAKKHCVSSNVNRFWALDGQAVRSICQSTDLNFFFKKTFKKKHLAVMPTEKKINTYENKQHFVKSEQFFPFSLPVELK